MRELGLSLGLCGKKKGYTNSAYARYKKEITIDPSKSRALLKKSTIPQERDHDASLEKLAHLIKICGFLMQTKVYLFWRRKDVLAGETDCQEQSIDEKQDCSLSPC